MKLTLATFGWNWDLFPSSGYRHGPERMDFRNLGHAEAVLKTLLAHEKDLSRVRTFMSETLNRRGLAKIKNHQLLTTIAHDLLRGAVLLSRTPVLNRGIVATGKVNEPIASEKEEWVEMEPIPPPEEESEGFSVSPETAQIMAKNNRELAESGTPMKELCSVGNCEVCKAQLEMIGA